MSEGRRSFVSITELFPQDDPDACRVCGEAVRPPKQKYCSEYCRTIAQNVQKLFSWNFLREYVARRDGECVRCGDTGSYEVDHIVPVANGGHPFDPDNMQRLCIECHNEKGMSETDFRSEDARTGGVRLFPDGSPAQLTFDTFREDTGSSASE